MRLAVDLRPVNAATLKEAWPMPHLEAEVNDFAASKCLACLDFVSSYWQLPLDPDSYSACGIVTPRGIVASKRVLPGLANAAAHFQRSIEPLFSELRDSMKAWLDDFNLHAGTKSQLLDALAKIFAICERRSLYLSARKCVLFAREIKWCGRLVSGTGYKIDPASLSGLKDMHLPATADELSQFLNCCKWMTLAIPQFVERTAALSELLEKAYSVSGRRTSRSIRRLQVHHLGWGPPHEREFLGLQDALGSAVTLAYPDPDKVISVFTDASERFWAGAVTQTTEAQLKLPLGEQQHDPIAILGSEFKKAQSDWTTFEKEGYAIFQTFMKMDYLLQAQKQTHVYTDHRNLLFVFAPLALEPALVRHIVSKVQRWALFLSRFPYVIEHVSGTENVFADIMTRWTKGYRRNACQLRAVTSMLL